MTKNSAAYMRQYRAARRKPVEARDCQHCRESFTPKRSDARYCGDACRAAARRERVEVKWYRQPWPKKNGLGCADPACDALHAQWMEYKSRVVTGEIVESYYWCEEHAAAHRARDK